MRKTVDSVQKATAEQFANIEIMKFMLLDLWNHYLHQQPDTERAAMEHRNCQLRHLQLAVDNMPDSFIRQALLSHAEENWRQIFRRLESEGKSFNKKVM